MSGTLRLRGSTSGYSELQAPAIAADQTFVLPTAGGTLLTTDSPVPKLTLELGSASQPSLTFQGDTDTGLFSEGTNTLNLVTGGSSKVVLGAAAHTIYAGTGATVRAIDIDSSGRLLVGTSTAREVEWSFGNAGTPKFQVEGNDGGSSQILITDTRSDGRNPSLAFAKTRNGTIVAENDILGSVSFFGDDGLDTRTWGGRITCEVDGTPGNNDMPGRLVFSTTADGASSPTERLRIDSSGNVEVKGGAELRVYRSDNTRYGRFYTDGFATILEANPSPADPLRLASADRLEFYAGSNERMRIDSSGNVNIGRQADHTDSTARLSVFDSGASASWSVRPGTNVSNQIDIIAYNYGTTTYLPTRNIGDSWIWFDGDNGERMRLDSAGSLLHGRTTPYHSGGGPEMLALQGARNGMVIFNTTNLDYYLITLRSTYANYQNNGLAGTYLIFQDQGGTVRGSIAVGTSTAYNTTSDYRQKENIVNLTGAIDRVKDLSPKRFNWIGRPSSEQIDGFIAHEAQAVVPQAVTGTKDEVDDDGNAVMQGIDQSKLVPLLTAALQEAIAKIETLEQRLSDAGIA